MPSNASLNLYQGDDWAALVSVFEADGTTPFDLTGMTPRAQIRRDVADRALEVLAEITIGVVDAAGGLLSLDLDHTVTAGLSGHLLWDLQLTDAAGEITTILAGGVNVTSEVTRETAGVAVAG